MTIHCTSTYPYIQIPGFLIAWQHGKDLIVAPALPPLLTLIARKVSEEHRDNAINPFTRHLRQI